MDRPIWETFKLWVLAGLSNTLLEAAFTVAAYFSEHLSGVERGRAGRLPAGLQLGWTIQSRHRDSCNSARSILDGE